MEQGFCPAIIIARGGSRRVPRKNVKEFCGKPLFAWLIEAAQGSRLFDEVFVSTDDEEISEITERWGATIIRRGAITADSEPGCVPMMRAVEWIEKQRPKIFTTLTMLPTSPCLIPGDLDRGMEIWLDDQNALLSWSHSPRETVIVRRTGKYSGIGILADQNYGYWASYLGHTICTADQYRLIYKGSMGIPMDNGEIVPTLRINYCPVKAWQICETDTPEEWEMAEFWFRRKILDVYGENPYGRKE